MTMLEILSAEHRSLLLSLSTMKKLAFLILLFDRMLPELHSYFLAQDVISPSFNKRERGFGDCCQVMKRLLLGAS